MGRHRGGDWRQPNVGMERQEWQVRQDELQGAVLGSVTFDSDEEGNKLGLNFEEINRVRFGEDSRWERLEKRKQGARYTRWRK